MISVKEALNIIEDRVRHSNSTRVPLQEAYDSILAEDVFSPINMPPFAQSSMDGYAFKFSENTKLKVIGEVQAGVSADIALEKGQAVRIFTGARVPNSADTVVIQEHVERTDGYIEVTKIPKQFANVRPTGEQIKVGDLALQKGCHLNEAALGFLAGLGINEVAIYQKPKVSLLITGNELQDSGKSLKEGQIYDSNSITLRLALKSIGIENVETAFVKDTLEATKNSLKDHLKKSDVVLVSGGISVGDYDFVQEAMIANGVDEYFYKVNQKPGKPLWFGGTSDKKVFALPGNPASSLSCFYIYVIPMLKKMMGHKKNHLTRKQAVSDINIKNPFGKTRFMKGLVVDGKATPLTGQASSMLKSYAISNALIIIPEDIELVNQGEAITYIDLHS